MCADMHARAHTKISTCRSKEGTGRGRGRVRYSRTYKLVVALLRALSLVRGTTR
jgi:hypothetical protein